MPDTRRVLVLALPGALALGAAVGFVAGRAQAPAAGPPVAGSGSTVSSPVASAPGTTSPAGREPTASELATPEIGFAVDMLDHHDQIIELSTFAAAHASSEMVRSLALGIIASQQYEKGLLESYLRAWGFTRPSSADRLTMAWMGSAVPREQMPGYLTKDEMVALYNLTGTDLDARFLELTVRHHEGGAHMAEDAAARANDPWLRDLAGKMVVAQRDEINDATAALQGAR